MDIKSIIKEKGYTIQDVAKKMGVNRVTLTLTLQGNPTYKKLKEIADAIDCNIVDFFRDETNNSSTCKGEDSELTALIQYKENFYKADTIEELKKIVAEIEEKHMQDKLKKLEEDKENLTREKTELHIKLQNEISETEKWKAKFA